MLVKYSKSGADLSEEIDSMLLSNSEAVKKQIAVTRERFNRGGRTFCNLCRKTLLSEKIKVFEIRGLACVVCEECGHIQSQFLFQEGYPHTVASVKYSNAYPNLSETQYMSRLKRIYQPKLDWIFDSLKASKGLTDQELLGKTWFEIGAGAGYFLKSLQMKGVKNLSGSDGDLNLVETANKMLGGNYVLHTNSALSDQIKDKRVNIIVAFFVLEHIEDLNHLLMSMRELKPGTIFVFSVPVFGMSTLIDMVMTEHFSRTLDGIFHLQTFTDSSISYALQIADFKLISQWIFGQDFLDLRRSIVAKLESIASPDLIKDWDKTLEKLSDSIQSQIDLNHFSDSRHLLAIKN